MFCLHLESGPAPLEILKTLPWVWQVAAKPITTQRCVLNQRGRGRGLWGGVLREWRQSCASPTKLELNFGKVSYSVVVHRQLACLFGTSDNKSPTPSQNAKVIHCPAQRLLHLFTAVYSPLPHSFLSRLLRHSQLRWLVRALAYRHRHGLKDNGLCSSTMFGCIHCSEPD